MENVEPRPNILWVCSDQQRFDTLGCYGSSFVSTPRLDAMARAGVLFENAFCQNPLCTPSRASFLTGRYPRTVRCYQNGQSIPQDTVLLPRRLKESGYVCGLSGKLHLSLCQPSACPGVERRIDDGYDVFHWSHHPDPDWAMNEYCRWLAENGQSYHRDAHPVSSHVQTTMAPEWHQTTWCAQKACGFMRAMAGRTTPWLFSVNIFDPHHPFDPPAEYLAPYLERLDEIPLPNYVPGELDKKPVCQRIDHEGAYGGHAGFAYDAMSQQDHRAVRAACWAMCDLIDDQVGAMLDVLEETGQLNNTIVIYQSDHGEMLGDHGIYLKGPHFYEPAVHVPLIVYAPGFIRGGRRIPGLVELTDLAPTLVEACGLPVDESMQGHSLWEGLTGSDTDMPLRQSVYCEYYNSHSVYDAPVNATMVRTNRAKLVRVHDRDEGELYDLAADPCETSNLWEDPASAGLRQEMLVLLADRMAETVDPLPLRPEGVSW